MTSRIFALRNISSAQSVHYSKSEAISDEKFMNSWATKAKKKEMMTSKEIEVARRTEYRRVNLAATYQKSFYNTGMTRIGSSKEQEREARHEFARTHI